MNPARSPVWARWPLPRACTCAVSPRSPVRAAASCTRSIDDGDLEKAQQAFKRAKMKVADTREVIVADVGPGGLPDVMLALADANVNVDLAYTALGGSKVVIATDDVFNAREALT